MIRVKYELSIQVTSGEQFIAIPRRQTGGACVGCSSHVNPEAAGVSDLAALAIKHIDRHEPTVRHLLEAVHDVERQVQVSIFIVFITKVIN